MGGVRVKVVNSRGLWDALNLSSTVGARVYAHLMGLRGCNAFGDALPAVLAKAIGGKFRSAGYAPWHADALKNDADENSAQGKKKRRDDWVCEGIHDKSPTCRANSGSCPLRQYFLTASAISG